MSWEWQFALIPNIKSKRGQMRISATLSMMVRAVLYVIWECSLLIHRPTGGWRDFVQRDLVGSLPSSVQEAVSRHNVSIAAALARDCRCHQFVAAVAAVLHL